MSGGSYGYIYCRLQDECKGKMYDEEMNDLITDLCKVLHDLEWWQSSDIGEESYRNTLKAFKKKWFEENREERLRKYIDEKMGVMRKEMYELIGLESEVKE